MSSTSEKSSTLTKSLFSAQTIVITGLIWGVLALLFFLLFSVPLPGEELPFWYSVGTYIFELGAYLLASIVCFRNWQSPQMVSGRNVWMGIGLGLLFYFIAGVVFGCWELLWELDPDVSLADIFYIFSYLFIGWGMTLAVTSKRLNLEFWQWGVLAGVAVAGVALAIWVAEPSFFGILSSPDTSVLEEVDIEEVSANLAPSWVLSIDQKLEPFAYSINLFYVIADVFLLIIATALLLAFWGGRFSQSWRMIAAATFSLYIADMYFKWSDSRIEGDYESGGLLEVFFVFTAILFGIGAVLEYDISTRSRQSRRSRRSSS
ncbi:MAG: hypothetical protein F6K25_06335 [Okeania sp. SIO2G4]|uniref:hypothetical protein n=1 Tax=unclassified Okeania TaxID=2634635 RepID=UPI0013B9C982|nr:MULTISPECIES: hypothetical protein [unclassified Okeania]NEP39117.1 hypothetical protein [Okeania sp. SIO2H7]NEP70478.1 hypothetical protein [Okeania sp. SIO2G5]NEP92680.1 hypothetical protein [Okeania sp. SIO2F5]NEQ90362.1 hypothetical protein [Okeania sp. SIO2G4]